MLVTWRYRSRGAAALPSALAVAAAGLTLLAMVHGRTAAATLDPCRAGRSAKERSAPACAGRDATGRNILLIIADDLGLEAATLYPKAMRLETEPPAPATPNLAGLARHGILFRNAWANPSCSPTRATILTGRYGFRTGMGWPIPPRGARRRVPPLPVEERTLPETFAASAPGRRYAMAMVGKWHQSSRREDPIRYGWPDFVGPDPTGEPGAIQNYFHWRKVVGGVVRMSRTYATTDMVDETLRRIRAARAQERPYFIWLALNAVHGPFHRPPDHLHSRHDLPRIGAAKRDLYEAMVEALDHELGRLFREVELADTTVIFLGDNGTPRDIIASPYNRKHGKLSLYEDGIRVPLLIAGAAVNEPGRVVRGLVQGVDLYPTILELAGIDPEAAAPPEMPTDGVSLMPYLASPDAGPVRATAYSEQFVAGDFQNRWERTVRNERFKYIERAPGLGVPEQEFFDLEADQHEERNLLMHHLASAEQAQVDRLRRSLRSLLATRCAGECGGGRTDAADGG